MRSMDFGILKLRPFFDKCDDLSLMYRKLKLISRQCSLFRELVLNLMRQAYDGVNSILV